MYKEETLVLTKKEETEVMLSEKEETIEAQTEVEQKIEPKEERKKQRFFSSSTFKKQSKESSIIEKPNYDFSEELPPEKEEKIFKIEKVKEEAKPKFNGKKLRIALFSLCMAVFTIWGVANVVKIDIMQHKFDVLYNEYYNINLPNYLKNLAQLDAVNESNMDNLFETIPEEKVPPQTIEKKSNWFDRICEFLVGLFGG